LAASAAAVALSSRGPVLFRQKRMGQGGREFVLVKFRTMRATGGGPKVTAGGDARITTVGRFLRKTKLDELPELWNVVTGDMALVGPRPEVPDYVDLDDPLWCEVLSARPGLTDPTTIALRNEEEVLSAVAEDREAFYLTTLQRYKLMTSAAYLRGRTWTSDLQVLVKTALAIALGARVVPPSIEEIVRVVEGKATASRPPRP
jgi:lipopolysaccharide/colanic/teichoic acid biosynthesis glycosyltransferase